MSFLSTWAQTVIVSVIIATILEMILPKGNNSKYIKMVIGVFVLFTIISPIINKFGKGAVNNIVDTSTYTNNNNSEITQSNVILNNEENIKKIYQQNLEIDIKSKVSQKGYIVGNINLEILNNGEYTLNKMEIKIVDKNNKAQNGNSNVTTIIENVENIKINVGKKNNEEQEKSVISESEKRKLREYLCDVYGISENNIVIN